MKKKINTFKEHQKNLVNHQNKLKSELKIWCRNTEIPLDERWNTFINSGLGDTSDRTNFGLDRDDDFLFDYPLFLEKYMTADVENILKVLIDAGKSSRKKFSFTKSDEVTFKEFCLNNFYSKMKFDW